MGAQPNKIIVNGNAKYDLLPTLTDPAIKKRFQKMLNMRASQKVLIAGSTREGEEALILDAYEEIKAKYPDLILIMVPRHIRRTQEIVELLKTRGHEYQLRSELDSHHKRIKKIVIIDTFGELFGLYSIGTIIFCGGSLVPKGGQNPFEAAIWGKVVFYGPYMDNFLDAKELLEHAGAGICVSTPNALAEKAIWFIQNPNVLSKCGTQAREAVMMCQGSAKKHGSVIVDLVNQTSIGGGVRNSSLT
jgi:3-deoxy-D-manno-octulosonic-acid transferase